MNLALIPLDELVLEIEKRTDDFILIYHQSRTRTMEDTEALYNGHTLTLLGMCEFGKDKLLKDYDRDETNS